MSIREIGTLVGGTYEFRGNPFLVGYDDFERPDSTTGSRLLKLKSFTLDQCHSAMALQLFCEVHTGGFLQVPVIKALQKRIQMLEAEAKA